MKVNTLPIIRSDNLKILIIHGSPRRGNTWNILNKVRENINKEIDVEYEIIELSKMKKLKFPLLKPLQITIHLE